MNLTQLIYVSTAVHELTADEIRQILESSNRHNAQQEITGLLLYASGSFLQVLEGEGAMIDETMSRILKDPLHHDIQILSDSPLDAREFGQWRMGFRGVTADDVRDCPGYAPFFAQGFDARSIHAHPGVALEILNWFAGRDYPTGS